MNRLVHEPLPVLLNPCGETAAIMTDTVAHMRTAESSLMIWSGLPGMGKTCASKQLRTYVRTHRDGNAEAAQNIVWGGALHGHSTRGMHRGLATVYKRFVGADSDRVLGKMAESLLAEDIVEALARRETILLCVDEAGTMSADEMRGVGMIIDRAIEVSYRLHILLISMDDITPKLKKHPVLKSRATFDRDFMPWSAEDVLQLLATYGAPLAAALDRDRTVGLALAEQLLDSTDGDLRTIGTVAKRMSEALAKPTPKKLVVDLCTLAAACLAAHRLAAKRRADRASIGTTRGRTRRRVA